MDRGGDRSRGRDRDRDRSSGRGRDRGRDRCWSVCGYSIKETAARMQRHQIGGK